MDIRTSSTGLPGPLLDALRRNGAARGLALPPGIPEPLAEAPAPAPGTAFGSALDRALRTVSASQAEATRLSDAFQADPGRVSLEQAMVATQKAQIGFQSALHVRNRLVAAYSDIMNMQV